ncbi:MAG: VCBS repeat-containing protein [Balneolaceae bacterium]|nr:VCBS repeat-containing protein [Balneolaceae bacterium]
MRNYTTLSLLGAVVMLLTACSGNTRFEKIPPSTSGVDFENTLVEDTTFNFLNYLYYYNGGGVAAGDINNDGLDDLFFTSNQNENKLYLNKGDFQFDDITQQAGVIHQEGSWSTGVAMADVNGDGWLDIFVSNVNYLSRTGHNQLFINNQDETFSEQSANFGLDFEGYSVQAAFFDYDKDGDLDLFLLNHSVHSIYSYAPIESRERIDPKSGDKLYRNDGDAFTEVSEQAGIFSSALGFGLGVTISDINEDGWPDIYVANDFHEDDYLYINNQDGTFTESIREVVQHTSQFSMSVDIADINNDGKQDIATTDMLPYEEEILKKSGGGDTYQVARIKESYGYYPQYSRNMLQLNRGKTPTGLPLFSEIGYLAGIEATDWSWSGLLADLDNDGFRDFYIANGIFRRPNDLDYIKFISGSDVQLSLQQGVNPENLKLVQRMPQLKIPNAVFKNNADLTFSDLSTDWGLGEESYSNGATYSDLDNDGDLDLIVNNVNQPAFIYRNETNSEEQSSNFVQFHLMGDDANTSGIGAKIWVFAEGTRFVLEQSPVRGFQSSMSHTLHLGLGESDTIDSIRVIWPDDRTQLLSNNSANTLIHLDQAFARETYSYQTKIFETPIFTDVTSDLGVNAKHNENEFIDFDNERLIPHKLSTIGPPLAVADVNNDGLEDFFIGNAALQIGEIWLQTLEGTFQKKENPELFEDRFNEDTDALFFDANGDEFPDLLVTSGGGQIVGQFRELLDRLYLNRGDGSFVYSQTFPAMYANSSVATNGDFDNDGDQDLFIGGLSVPGLYGLDPVSFLLQNDGRGNFTDVTDIIAPQLRNVGMVTDAVWLDTDEDGDQDLVVTGEWMPIKVFSNILSDVANADTISTIFEEVTEESGLLNTEGWWNSLDAVDIDGDGDLDIVAGNLGLNSYLNASLEEPVKLYLNDFNVDQKADPIVVRTVDGKEYPLAMVDELFEQLTGLRKNFNSYQAVSSYSLKDWFYQAALDSSIQKTAVFFESVVLENKTGVEFEIHRLPMSAQFAPIYSATLFDANADGINDLYLNGNFYGVRPLLGRYDANFGEVLIQDSAFSFSSAPFETLGEYQRNQVRDVESISLSDGRTALLVSQNDGELVILTINQPKEQN